MNRRDLLIRAAAASAASAVATALPLSGFSPLTNLLSGTALAAEGDATAAAFEAALARQPALIGWQGNPAERAVPSVRVEGRLPPDLAGTLYRNGPAQHSVGGARYRHWFDGDGMVHGWTIADGSVGYRGRYVRTRKFQAEAAAGRMLVSAFGTRPKGAMAAPPDGLNPANISVLPVAGALLALWEAGSAYDLDPRTLETRGERVWRPDLAGLPFSAHPKVEPDGTVWNFGVGYPEGRLMLWRITPQGTLGSFDLLDIRHPGMLHDMAVTERSLVFALPPYLLDRERLEGTSFLDAHRWNPEAPLRILAVDKADPSKRRVWELPAGFGFHFGNAWEEADGTIRFDFMLAGGPGAVTGPLRDVMTGRLEPSGAPPRAALVTLSAGGKATVEPFGPETAEFPRVDPRRVGTRNRLLVHLVHPADRLWFSTVVCREVEDGAAQRFDYGPDYLAEEHIVVPRPGGTAEGDGWILGTALHVPSRRTVLNLFETRRLSDGPLASAWLEFPLPLGLHGQFVAA